MTHTVSPWLSIIGIGEDGVGGLGPAARAALSTAELVFGGDRHLALLPETGVSQDRRSWPSPLSDGIEALAALRGRRQVAVLASGDPLWFGIGATLAVRFPAEELVIFPAVSAFQLAAARLGWPQDGVECLSFHARSLERLAGALFPGARILALTDDAHNPAAIARYLHARGLSDAGLTLLERLGSEAERIETRTVADWLASPEALGRVDRLNLVAIACPPARMRADGSSGPFLPSPLAGLRDGAYAHDGMLTKQVVRAATLAALAPMPGELLWDLGAGCGSVAIEWMRAHPRNRAVAVEREAVRCSLIRSNADTLGVPELDVVNATAEAATAVLPDPDAVFIGGGLTAALLDHAWERLLPGGRLVANAVSVAGEAVLLEGAGRLPGARLTRIAVADAEPLGGELAFRPHFTVTQFAITRSGGGS